jgi:hypothetical protein
MTVERAERPRPRPPEHRKLSVRVRRDAARDRSPARLGTAGAAGARSIDVTASIDFADSLSSMGSSAMGSIGPVWAARSMGSMDSRGQEVCCP